MLAGTNLTFFTSYQELFDNTKASPSPDGGGSLAEANVNFANSDYSAECANVPYTFLNEDTCILSKSADACGIGSSGAKIGNGLDYRIPLDKTTIRALYDESGAGDGGTIYLYAVDKLRIDDDTLVPPPCQADAKSRWTVVDCPASTTSTVGPDTVSTFIYLITVEEAKDSNPYVIDVTLKDSSCAEGDEAKVGFLVTDEASGKCYKNGEYYLLYPSCLYR